MTDDSPEDKCNSSEFLGPARDFVSRICNRKGKAVVVEGSPGIRNLRPDLFSLLLATNAGHIKLGRI